MSSVDFFVKIFVKNLKVGSLFVLDNSEQKNNFTIFVTFFGVKNLKVG